MRLEVFTVVCIHPEDAESVDLQNAGILPHHYMVSRPRPCVFIVGIWVSHLVKMLKITNNWELLNSSKMSAIFTI